MSICACDVTGQHAASAGGVGPAEYQTTEQLCLVDMWRLTTADICAAGRTAAASTS